MAAIQAQVPGGAYLNQAASNEAQVPGGEYVNEAGAAGGPGAGAATTNWLIVQ